jgi:hypothetical protein
MMSRSHVWAFAQVPLLPGGEAGSPGGAVVKALAARCALCSKRWCWSGGRMRVSFLGINRSILKDLEFEAEGSESDDAKSAIKAKGVTLSRASGIVCSWTSFVAVRRWLGRPISSR